MCLNFWRQRASQMHVIFVVLKNYVHYTIYMCKYKFGNGWVTLLQLHIYRLIEIFRTPYLLRKSEEHQKRTFQKLPVDISPFSHVLVFIPNFRQSEIFWSLCILHNTYRCRFYNIKNGQLFCIQYIWNSAFKHLIEKQKPKFCSYV